MNKYISRLTSSSRGEPFNKLAWLFLLPTFFVGLALSVGIPMGLGGIAEMMAASLNNTISHGAVTWGVIAMFNIVMGSTFLLFQFPPFGKASGLAGFMLWVWAGLSFAISELYLLVLIICLPQAVFWIWQYLALSRFRGEDKDDAATMKTYNTGGYDNELTPKQSKIDREDNRGRDVQSNQSYDTKDDGTDSSRTLDAH